MQDPTPQFEENELDIVLVANPDVNCTDETMDVLKTTRRVQDPDTGAYSTVYDEVVDNWAHNDFFQVRWAGQPHRIRPGETRRMPRFLAKHFAKHLADHLLIKEEEKTGKKGLMQHPIERPKVLATIIVKVEEHFLQDTLADEGQQTAKMVDDLNLDTKKGIDLGTEDMGKVEDPMIGKLVTPPPTAAEMAEQMGEDKTPEPSQPQEPDKTPAELVAAEPWNPDKPKPTRKELLGDCERLGIMDQVKPNMNVDQLIGLIQQF